jgi:hypothetical protein
MMAIILNAIYRRFLETAVFGMMATRGMRR